MIKPVKNRNYRDDLGQPINGSPSAQHVTEPIINTSNPNLTYTNTNGGQQSTIAKVWESYAIKDAPRGTIVKAPKHKFKTVSSTHITGTKLWYYQLKEVGDRS